MSAKPPSVQEGREPSAQPRGDRPNLPLPPLPPLLPPRPLPPLPTPLSLSRGRLELATWLPVGAVPSAQAGWAPSVHAGLQPFVHARRRWRWQEATARRRLRASSTRIPAGGRQGWESIFLCLWPSMHTLAGSWCRDSQRSGMDGEQRSFYRVKGSSHGSRKCSCGSILHCHTAKQLILYRHMSGRVSLCLYSTLPFRPNYGGSANKKN